MMYFDCLKERGVYDIDVVESEKDLVGLTVDTRRNKYYVIKPEGHLTKSEKAALELLKNEIINKIALKKYNGELTGETKLYSQAILDMLSKQIGLSFASEKENDETIGYCNYIRDYNTGKIAENKMNKLVSRQSTKPIKK